MARMKNYKTEANEDEQVRQLVREYWDSLEDDRMGNDQSSHGMPRHFRRE